MLRRDPVRREGAQVWCIFVGHLACPLHVGIMCLI